MKEVVHPGSDTNVPPAEQLHRRPRAYGDTAAANPPEANGSFGVALAGAGLRRFDSGSQYVAALLGRVNEVLGNLAEAAMAVILIGDVLCVAVNVLLREAFSTSLLWVPEASADCVAVLAFFGCAVAYRHRGHMSLQAISAQRWPVTARYCGAISEGVVAGMCIWVAVGSYHLVQVLRPQQGLQLKLSPAWPAAAITVGMVLTVLIAVERLLRQPIAVMIAGFGVPIVVALVARVTIASWSASLADPGAAIATTALIGILALVLGVPVGFVLMFSSLVYDYFTDVAPASATALQMNQGVSSFLLVAIPFFVFAGIVAARGGVATRLGALVRAAVGWMRGGTYLALIGTMYVFSGISGSKGADIAAVGTSMADELAEEGYPRSETAAVLTASAVMGETIPPSLALLVVSSVTTVSVSALFISGLIPAAFLAAVLVLCVLRRSSVKGLPGRRPFQLGELRRAALRSPIAVIFPIILIVGIATGWATPSEVSAIGAVYAVLAVLAFRGLRSFRAWWRAARESSVLIGMIMFTIAAANTLSVALSYANVPKSLARLLEHVPGGHIGFLLISLVLLIVMGMVFEGLAALIVFAPLLLPIATTVGIDPLQYSIILVLAMGVGSFAPPIGVGAFMATSVVGTTMRAALRPIAYYLAFVSVGIVIIALWPGLTLWLPHTLHVR